MSDLSPLKSLRHPLAQLIALDSLQPGCGNVPLFCWSILVFIAVGGSCLYGSSLAFVIEGFQPGPSALLLTLSGGFAWCIFGPILVLVTRRNAIVLAHACLVTMAYGEAVLAVGALLNLSGLPAAGLASMDPSAFNCAWVALSNVVMALALSIQLAALKVPPWKTLLTWTLVLNGSGIGLFLMLSSILR
jgi:hypothetical protein